MLKKQNKSKLEAKNKFSQRPRSEGRRRECSSGRNEGRRVWDGRLRKFTVMIRNNWKWKRWWQGWMEKCNENQTQTRSEERGVVIQSCMIRRERERERGCWYQNLPTEAVSNQRGFDEGLWTSPVGSVICKPSLEVSLRARGVQHQAEGSTGVLKYVLKGALEEKWDGWDWWWREMSF